MWSDEGLIFTDPDVFDDYRFNQWVNQTFPYANESVKQDIINKQYPSSSYSLTFFRLDALISGDILWLRTDFL